MFLKLIASVLFLISSTAYAETAVLNPAVTQNIIMMVSLFGIFYFLIWRPQSKRSKEQKSLLDGLAKGDEVLTTGGIVGKVVNLNAQFVLIEVSNGINISAQKQAISQIFPKNTLREINKELG